MRYVLGVVAVTALAGCAGGLGEMFDGGMFDRDRDRDRDRAAPEVLTDPVIGEAEAEDIAPQDDAVRADAVAAGDTAAGDAVRGFTVASLGDASIPGLWIETPLVDRERLATVVAPDGTNRRGAARASVGGDERGSDSRLSLARSSRRRSQSLAGGGPTCRSATRAGALAAHRSQHATAMLEAGGTSMRRDRAQLGPGGHAGDQVRSLAITVIRRQAVKSNPNAWNAASDSGELRAAFTPDGRAVISTVVPSGATNRRPNRFPITRGVSRFQAGVLASPKLATVNPRTASPAAVSAAATASARTASSWARYPRPPPRRSQGPSAPPAPPCRGPFRSRSKHAAIEHLTQSPAQPARAVSRQPTLQHIPHRDPSIMPCCARTLSAHPSVINRSLAAARRLRIPRPP
jgi:hypothetical protein